MKNIDLIQKLCKFPMDMDVMILTILSLIIAYALVKTLKPIFKK